MERDKRRTGFRKGSSSIRKEQEFQPDHQGLDYLCPDTAHVDTDGVYL